MGKKISDEIKQKIPVLYEETHNKTEVARQLNISIASVNKYLNLSGIEEVVQKPKKQHKSVTDEDIKQINELYAEYCNMAEVSRKTGFSTSTIQKYLTEENKALKEKMYDDRDALWYYIYRLFGQASPDNPVSAWNITQMTKFKNQGYSYKAQLLTLKYFYEVKKHSTKKANGSIGIIPFVYTEARLYYDSIIDQQERINNAIQEQLEKDRIEIQFKPFQTNRKKKKQINLEEIEGDNVDSN